MLEQLSVNADLSSSNYKSWRALPSPTPSNVHIAVKLARLYIDQARDKGDPRYL